MQSIFSRIHVLILASVLAMLVTGFLVLPLSAQAQPNEPAPVTGGPLKPADTEPDLPVYSGVDQSIEAYLCTPKGLGTDLYDCVGRLYRFGITIGAIALVFFIVVAGYLYITGGESGKGKAKNMIFSALTGMGLLLGSYVLLNFINPALVEIRPIQPPIFSTANLPSCDDIGFGAACVTSTGQVSSGGGGVAGSASEAKWKDLITKNASAKQLPYCVLSALIQKESTFQQYTASNFGRPGGIGNIDPNSSNKKFYNLTFTHGYTATAVKGHGIGLTQVYIAGPPSKPAWPWQDSSTPSRQGSAFGFNRYLTVTDLINPDTNISAGAHYFANTSGYLQHKNVLEAYKKYTGGHENAALKKMVGYYDACQLRNKS